MNKTLMQWIGETKEDKINLWLGYLGGLTCPVFAYGYYLLLVHWGIY